MRVSKVLGEKKYELAKIEKEIEFKTIQELAEITTKNIWSPFLYQAGHPDAPTYKHRKASNMVRSEVFAADVDGGLSLSDALARLQASGLSGFIGTSKSHQLDKGGAIADRFRIVFLLNRSLVGPHEVRPLFEKVKKIFPELDESCKDAARFYFPCKDIVYVQEGLPLQVPEITQETRSPLTTSNRNGQRYPLAKATYELILNGAAPGSRNAALITATQDAIQQQWSQDDFLKLLETSEHEWLYDEQACVKVDERYRNFLPTHPPRVPMSAPPPSARPIRLPLNHIRAVLVKWLEENDVAVSYNRTLYLNGVNCLGIDVVRKVVLSLAEANMGVDERLVEYNLQEWIEEKRLAHLDAVRSDINNYEPEKGLEECRRFLGVFKAAYTALDLQVLRHMLWQVKRKLNNLPTKYEMMFVMTGGQGAGKSHALRRYLFRPLGDLAHSSAGFEALQDQRESRLFSDHYIVMFDEMSGAAKADMERVKQMITSGVIKQRRMGTTSHDSIPMNATFFGTANPPLETLIRDTTGMRRFWEIQTDAAHETSKRWAVLDEIDFNLLWAAVDHKDEIAPIEAVMADLQIQQEMIRDKSIVEWLLVEGIIEKTNEEQHFTSALALSHVVDLTMGQKWSSKNLAKEWKRFDISKKRVSGGTKYGVRIVDTDILNALSTKYGMRIKAGEF